MIFAEQFWNNDTLDKWSIPFGLWIEEITFWLTTNIKPVLDGIKWPVDQLLNFFIDNLLQTWLPWPVVLLLFLLLGAYTRNFKVGLGSAVALLVCGLLGDDYWNLTMETIGMIIVAVIICAVIGIPLGILSARVDPFWNRLRPILDGMQVVHPFVYLLPIIFLFGVRRTPGVLATLVFALPPIVRLTNLGIRQVPDDVVEAARAFGASESRVLREVQLPLARPAIMAGLNQTLLLSLSMVGIVAIIAGGGLGKPILTALATANIPIGASAGAGLYFVGVLLDRISQPEAGEERVNLFARMRDAWANRKDPVVPPLPTATIDDPDAELIELMSDKQPVTLSLGHRIAAQAAVIGGAAAAIGATLTWANDASRISTYVRADDADVSGAHSGISALGGSWFGFVILALGVGIALCGLIAMALPASRSSNLTKLPTFVAAGTAIVALIAAYLSVPPTDDAYSNGIGLWFALGGGLLILVSAIAASIQIELNPKRAKFEVGGAIVMGAVALFLIFAAAAGSWILDQRNNAAEIAAELAAEADGVNEGGVAAEILAEAMSGTRRVAILGMEAEGPRIGYAVAGLAVLAALLAAIRYISPGRIQRTLSFLIYGIGLALITISIAWIATVIRLDVQQMSPGASAFLTGCGGAVLMTIARGQITAHEARAIRPVIDEPELGEEEIEAQSRMQAVRGGVVSS